jgi:SNF2 family DNA or RNA helicase
MTIQLMPHQQKWADSYLDGDLKERHGIPLFGEAGTGKTYPVAEVATELLTEHGGHALFAVPTRLVWNWLLELQRMRPEIPSIQTLVIHGSRKERADQFTYLDTFMQIGSMFVIVGYDALRIEQQRFQDYEFTILASDEAHKIKNPRTQTARALKSINAKYRIALSGTPITNRPNDLWSILHFLDPGPEMWRNSTPVPPKPGRRCPLPKHDKKWRRKVGCTHCRHWLEGVCEHGTNTKPKPSVPIRYRRSSPTWGGYNAFIKQYCQRTWDGYRMKVTGGKNMAELHRRLNEFGMTRWLIDDVLRLKPMVFQHVVLEPTKAETTNYQRVKQGIISMLDGDLSVSYFSRTNPLALMTYLRQCTVLTPTAFAALRGGLLNEILENNGDLMADDVSSKEEWLLDLLESTNGEKVLIYGHWIGALDHLKHTLEENGIKAVGIYGNNNKNPKAAIRIMQDFASDPELRVVFGNESMEEGINLQAARYVVFMHLPWIPKSVVQFIGRARRVGQQRTVIAYFLSHKDSIDEAMAETCLEKQQASDDIFDPEFAGRSSMFDISTGQGLLDLLRQGG